MMQNGAQSEIDIDMRLANKTIAESDFLRDKEKSSHPQCCGRREYRNEKLYFHLLDCMDVHVLICQKQEEINMKIEWKMVNILKHRVLKK
jgi:hypothetical protein